MSQLRRTFRLFELARAQDLTRGWTKEQLETALDLMEERTNTMRRTGIKDFRLVFMGFLIEVLEAWNWLDL
jgi:hypothetical protein